MRKTRKQLLTELQAYYRTPAWKKRREACRLYYGGRCGLCYGQGTQAHHRTYERLYNELPQDLIWICTDCHKFADRMRRRRMREQRAIRKRAKKVISNNRKRRP